MWCVCLLVILASIETSLSVPLRTHKEHFGKGIFFPLWTFPLWHDDALLLKGMNSYIFPTHKRELCQVRGSVVNPPCVVLLGLVGCNVHNWDALLTFYCLDRFNSTVRWMSWMVRCTEIYSQHINCIRIFFVYEYI